MRNSKTVKLMPGLVVTVQEFSVAEVVSLLEALGNVLYNDAEINRYIDDNLLDMQKRASALLTFHKSFYWAVIPNSWLMKRYAAVLLETAKTVNHAYFSEPATELEKKKFSESKKKSKKKCSDIAKGIKNSLEVLIREGHSEPYNYGWGFFMNAVETQEKLVKEDKKK